MQLLGPVMKPRFPTVYNSPADWTLIQAWDTAVGDMVAIKSAFNDSPRGSTNMVLSPDGIHLTLGSTNDDTIRTFSLSTPFDPDTATLISTRNALNPGHMFANKVGSILWVERATDTYEVFPMSNFILGQGSTEGTMNKAEAGFAGSGDLTYYARDDFAYLIADGPITDPSPGVRVRRIDFVPPGDLDNPFLGPLSGIDWSQNGGVPGSKISKDETTIYRALGSSGIEILKMSTPGDPSTMSFFSIDDIQVEITFLPDSVFMNPENTTEVWIVGDNGSSQIQLARMLTNV